MLEPGAGHLGDGLERAGLLEQMAGAGHDPEQLLAGQRGQRLPVQLEDVAVVAADDQQRGRHDLGKPRPCEVRASAARHHRGDPVVEFRGREQGRAGAGAGAEQAERQIGDVGLAADPERRFHHAFGKQRNVEDVAAVVRFGWRQQVEEKGGEAVGIERCPRRRRCAG